MADVSFTNIEQRAQQALNSKAFPLNLRNVRDTVELLLNEVARYGFFNEYTDHSFSHVLDMLKTADWIIPESSKNSLTSADYLMLTLSIYFHDLGLLISREEYAKRASNTDYVKFKSEPPIEAKKYAEFIARLDQLAADDRDRILYSEFVRFTHGSRIAAWLTGASLDDNEASIKEREIIHNLFKGVDPTICNDLALLCESHTKDDIGDVKRFKVSQPYGGNEDETVNLQYLAAILRTVDLLQITNKRAPSVLYQLINPSDPVSQLEWQKQGAVRSVRRKYGFDRDGKADAQAPSDTIEVHARFEDSEGFFGLTSYLQYAERELASTHAAIQQSNKLVPSPPLFPWKNIDASGVEASGFLTESFGFTLDQEKILNLLTGHTLYNNTTVVLREMTQNALDAVRLQRKIDQEDATTSGSISIKWDTESRALIITDNGTGMSQETIENHLLKVGSSRYQDPKFRDRYPGFSSISRFGIGVLSAFMVSDDVQITTCNPDDVQARRIALRSVHGKYLIKLLDKVSDRNEIGVFPHGTSVRIVLRPTADIGDVLQIARMWLLFPRCDVSVTIDNAEPVTVGYNSPKDAIKSYLQQVDQGRSESEIDVKEFSEGGVTLAFAVRKNNRFKDWSFLHYFQDQRAPDREVVPAPVGTCVEGVCVEFSSPGFNSQSILAVANAIGDSAPKTNVARSALEETVEQRNMLAIIYNLYTRHVTSEIDRLTREEQFSLSRAVGEAPYIASPLIGQAMQKPNMMKESYSRIPLVMVEDNAGRRNISFNEIKNIGSFWTIESPLSRSIETFIREAPSDIKADTLIKTLGNASASYPVGTTMCNFASSSYVSKMIRSEFEISEVAASDSLRRINIKWSRRDKEPRWLSSDYIMTRVGTLDSRFWHQLMSSPSARQRQTRNSGAERLHFPIANVAFSGLEQASGFISDRDRYLRSGTDLALFLAQQWTGQDDVESLKRMACYNLIMDVILFRLPASSAFSNELIHRFMDDETMSVITDTVSDMSQFIQAAQSFDGVFFDPYAWDRRPNLEATYGE